MKAIIVKDTTPHGTTGIEVVVKAQVPAKTYLKVTLENDDGTTESSYHRTKSYGIFLCDPVEKEKNISKLMDAVTGAPTQQRATFSYIDENNNEHTGTGIFTEDELEFIG